MKPVRVFRRFRDLRQTAFAEAAGIRQGYLSEIERGAKAPSLATAPTRGAKLAGQLWKGAEQVVAGRATRQRRVLAAKLAPGLPSSRHSA